MKIFLKSFKKTILSFLKIFQKWSAAFGFGCQKPKFQSGSKNIIPKILLKKRGPSFLLLKTSD